MSCSTFLFVQLSCSLLFDDNLPIHFAADFLRFNNKSFSLRLAVRGHDWGVGGAGGFGSSLAGGETKFPQISKYFLGKTGLSDMCRQQGYRWVGLSPQMSQIPTQAFYERW